MSRIIFSSWRIFASYDGSFDALRISKQVAGIFSEASPRLVAAPLDFQNPDESSDREVGF
jgi:hypothetical protein